MRRLLDPCGTLGKNANTLSIELVVILVLGLAIIPCSSVLPARFSSAIWSVFAPINFCLGRGLQSLKLKASYGDSFRWAMTILAAIFVGGAAAAWFDYTTHSLPEHLGMSSPIMARTPFFRVLAGTSLVFALYCAGVLIARARQVSYALSEVPTV